MPDCTIVASWRVAITKVVGLDAPEAPEDVASVGRLLLLDVDDDQASFERSCAAPPACLSPASISPLVEGSLRGRGP